MAVLVGTWCYRVGALSRVGAWSHACDLQTDTHVTVLVGTWCYGVSDLQTDT